MIETQLNHWPDPLAVFSPELTQDFNESTDVVNTYGGKGAGLLFMHSWELPVPAAIIIPTCVSTGIGDLSLNDSHAKDTIEALVEESIYPAYCQLFGDGALTSARSGAPISMPGMMDSILNIGLTRSNMADWRTRLGDRTAIDCLRRYLQMMGTTYFSIPGHMFESEIKEVMGLKLGKKDKPTHDSDMTVAHLQRLIKKFANLYDDGGAIPELTSVKTQLKMSLYAVYASYYSERAVHYRKLEKIDPAMGTAVCLQQMAFGNKPGLSCTGVIFSRDPRTGAATPVLDFLPNAQGEDVVAGYRETLDLGAFHDFDAGVYSQLLDIVQHVEDRFSDMVDIEFTVESGELYILQCRVGKRSAHAAFKIARDMLESQTIIYDQAISRVTPAQYSALRQPMMINPPDPHITGTAVSGGVVRACAVASAAEAAKCSEPYILVREMTDAEDIVAMSGAVGVLTQTGGATCHAAVVARSLNIPCVVGVPDLMTIPIPPDVLITMDGRNGHVWFDIDTEIVDDSSAIDGLISWVMPENDGLELERVYHTETGCWADLVYPVCVDVRNLETVEEFYVMLVEALHFQSIVIDSKLATVRDFDSIYKSKLGVDVENEGLTDDTCANFYEALVKVANEYEVDSIVILLDETNDQLTADHLQALGYWVIKVTNSVEKLVLNSGTLIISDDLVSDIGQDVYDRLLHMKAAVDPNLNVYSYPITKEKRIMNRLQSIAQ